MTPPFRSSLRRVCPVAAVLVALLGLSGCYYPYGYGYPGYAPGYGYAPVPVPVPLIVGGGYYGGHHGWR